MIAVILAGGKGTRLKPYTITLPKPLVPVADEPILKLIIDNLKSQGVTEFRICVNHMGELISSYFGDGSEHGVNINYSCEKKPLGTVAPIKLIKDLPDNFLVMNGDIITDLSVNTLYEEHMKSGAILTIATHERDEKIDYGVLDFDDHGYINKFEEKPVFDFNVSMGLYVFSKRVFDYVPDNTYFGFDDLMLTLLEHGEKVKAYPYMGYWMDIGRPSDYEQADMDMRRKLGMILYGKRKGDLT